MKTLILAMLGTTILVGNAAATQYRFWGDDRGVTVHAPYQQRFDQNTQRRIDDQDLSRSFGLTNPSPQTRPRRTDRGLVYKSDEDPGIVLHGRRDGYTYAR